jgi:hypothetical protein
MDSKNYENYIPGHLDDPKYVGNFEFNTLVIAVLTLFFFTILFFQGERLLSLFVLLTGILVLKYKTQLGNFLDGWVYWHFGITKVPLKKIREFGVIPTFIHDFEE